MNPEFLERLKKKGIPLYFLGNWLSYFVLFVIIYYLFELIFYLSVGRYRYELFDSLVFSFFPALGKTLEIKFKKTGKAIYWLSIAAAIIFLLILIAAFFLLGGRQGYHEL